MTTIIDWTTSELRPAPRVGNPNQRERFYKATCGRCGNVRWLRAHDARRAERLGMVCGICQRVMAGRKGYAVTAARHGLQYVLVSLRNRQLDNPTKPELAFMKLLDEAGVPYEPQVIFTACDARGKEHGFVLDFVIKGVLAVEVNGYRHTLQRGIERDNWLKHLWTGALWFVKAEDVLNDPAAVREKLLTLVGNKRPADTSYRQIPLF